MENVDYIIVGQGLSGSLLGWELLNKGFRIKLIDNGYQSSASMVAAGILNPITGMRIVKSWQVDAFLDVAKATYKELENELEVKFFKELEILRLFKNKEEVSYYEKRKVDQDYERYLGEYFEPGIFKETLNDHHGSFTIKEAGNLDTKIFLNSMREYFSNKKVLQEEPFDYEAVEIAESSACYKGIMCKKILFCEGYKATENPWFKDLKWNPNKGEILTVKLDYPLPDKVINSGKWLLPIGRGLYRAGSSFDWDHADNLNTQCGRQEIIKGLSQILKRDDIEVTNQEAGVRPCTKDTKPYIGLHGLHKSLGVFNGFGSKGTLMIPHYAKQFANFLHLGKPLDNSVNTGRK